MAAKKHSRLHNIHFATDGLAGTYNALNSLREATWSGEKTMVECTTRESGQNREYLDGLKGQTVQINCAKDESDAVLMAIFDRFESNATLHMRWRNDTAGGLRQKRAEVKIASIEEGAPVDDLQTLDISLQITGAVTADTQ